MSDHQPDPEVIEFDSASEPEQDLEAELAPGTLAAIWENHRSLRRRVTAGSFLTEWPKNPKGQSTEGIPSVAAMSLNPLVLEAIAEWWCPFQPTPKAVPVNVLRREVWLTNKNTSLKSSLHSTVHFKTSYSFCYAVLVVRSILLINAGPAGCRVPQDHGTRFRCSFQPF